MKSASGQVIVGGRSHHDTEIFSSIELFPRPPSKACQIPNNPTSQLKRESHSLSLILGGVFVICGGSDGSNDLDSCISWSAGKASWTQMFTMRYICMMINYAALSFQTKYHQIIPAICHLFLQGQNFRRIKFTNIRYASDMTQLLLLGKFEYTGEPIFKVVLEC